MKMQRNAVCSCGSGKKYKHCCGAQERSPMRHVEALMRLAAEHQIAGRVAQARALFRDVLQVDPNNAQAMHGLRWLAHLDGDEHEAVRLLRYGLRLSPSDWAMHYNLGRVLKSLSMSSEAET